MSIFLNNKISDFLTALQAWLQEKYSLLNFILGKFYNYF